VDTFAARDAAAKTVEAEIVQPLDHTAAERLDKRIRLLVNTLCENVAKVEAPLIEAEAGQIHLTLGFKSWTAYLADTLAGRLELNTEGRRKVVELLAGHRMSQRAIAQATGVGRTTVQRDLAALDSQMARNGPAETVIGRDGKTSPATPKQDMHEAEYEVEADEELPRCDVDDDFDDDVEEDDDSPATHRFGASWSICNYVEQVAAIGLATDNGVDIDLVTPLTADDLPADLGGSRADEPQGRRGGLQASRPTSGGAAPHRRTLRTARPACQGRCR
jgi:transposase